MSVITLSRNPQIVTLPANTEEHEINCDAFIPQYSSREALIKRKSGTSAQFSSTGASITSDSAALDATDDRFLLNVQNGIPLKVKGGVGSESFSVTIIDK